MWVVLFSVVYRFVFLGFVTFVVGLGLFRRKINLQKKQKWRRRNQRRRKPCNPYNPPRPAPTPTWYSTCVLLILYGNYFIKVK
jgi:hypothetical protein